MKKILGYSFVQAKYKRKSKPQKQSFETKLKDRNRQVLLERLGIEKQGENFIVPPPGEDEWKPYHYERLIYTAMKIDRN